MEIRINVVNLNGSHGITKYTVECPFKFRYPMEFDNVVSLLDFLKSIL